MASRSVLRLATAGAFIAGALIRRDAAVALLVLGFLLVVLERRFPRRRQVIFRKGFATDCVHFVVDEVLAAVILAAGLAVAAPAIRVVVPSIVSSTLELQPSWLVLVEGLFVAEVAGYWGHRATHEIGVLWRFHQLHHSIETMDWLAPNRRHPVDMALARASVILPLLALGFSLPTIAAPFAIKRFQGLLVHANLRLNAGPITWLIATPEFHHWHHADHPEAYNKNYAGRRADVVCSTNVAQWQHLLAEAGVLPGSECWVAGDSGLWHQLQHTLCAGRLPGYRAGRGRVRRGGVH